MIVGHNPTIGAMASILSGNEIIEFKPSSFAVFNLTIETWKMFRVIKAENILNHTP
jgi:phosphohistidine phosphatase SixA